MTTHRPSESSSSSGSISTTLLEQVRAQRPEAWQRLVDLYSPLIYRWCRGAGVPEHDAADLLQEVFSAVLRHLPTFRRSRPGDSFTAWLAAITRNEIRGYYRRRRSRSEAHGGTTAQMAMAAVPEEPEPLEDSVLADATSRTLLQRRVLEMIRVEFRDRTWQTFLKTAVEGQSAAHVAEDLGMSVAAVYMAKSRVLRRLREAIAELED